MGDFWVFGYGSLLWNPGFEFVEERTALLHGYRRALCIHSWVHRGTRESPGLVMGLDRGGSCKGIARRVAAGRREAVIAYLRERELVTHVYLERWVRVRLADPGETVEALTYVVDTNHPQYAGAMPPGEVAGRVRGACGRSGANTDYVVNTVKALRALGIHDHRLEAVFRELQA